MQIWSRKLNFDISNENKNVQVARNKSIAFEDLIISDQRNTLETNQSQDTGNE